MTYEYSLESLNFVAFTKPNKHKMRSKSFFSTTWPDLFSSTFATVGEFLRLLQSFVSIRVSQHDRTVLHVIQLARA